MSSTLFTNIHKLVNTRSESPLLRGEQLAELPIIDNAWLLIEDNEIAGFGSMTGLDEMKIKAGQLNVRGQVVLPCWCDSHSHLVFAASREEEFVQKIRGKSYAQIAAKGGGILNSAKKLNETSENELFVQAWKKLEEVSALGTGAIEIKSGYGLTVEGELKMLRVIKKLKQKSRLTIKATFLGAHSYPSQFANDHEGYIRMIIHEMLPVIASEKLADFIDVFCENGFFSPDETERICLAGIQCGLRAKIHANQLSISGGTQTGVKIGAVSVDHLEAMDADAIQCLASSDTIGTLLPQAAFFLRMQYQPARELIDAGCAIALASDYNPGTSPSGNMNFVVALSCIQLKMLPEEAINAATLNGAHAMESAPSIGSITIGKKANIIFTKQIPSLAYIPYSFASNLIDKVMIEGEWV